MSLTKDEVKHIAELARIGVDEEELEKFSTDLSAVLDWISKLEEADVSAVSPMARVAGSINVAREDRMRESDSREEIIRLFPEERNGYDKVKSVL